MLHVTHSWEEKWQVWKNMYRQDGRESLKSKDEFFRSITRKRYFED